MRLTAPLLFAAAALVSRAVFAGDTPVFTERLDDGNTNDSGYRGLTTTGVLVAGPNGGWKVTDGASQIRYDSNSTGKYPDGLACGSVEVDFRALDPIGNFQGLANCGGSTGYECYVNFVGVYEGTHGDFHKSGTKDEAFLLVHAMHEKLAQDAWRNSRLKFMGGSWNWNDVQNCIVNSYLPPMNKDDQAWPSLTEAVYTAKVSWSCAGAQYELVRKDPDGGTWSWSGGGSWSWIGDPGDHQPNFRHVFIGKDNATPFFIPGTIFQRVLVTEHAPCDCPALEPDAGAADAGTGDAGGVDASVPPVDAGTGEQDAAPDGGAAPVGNDGGCGCSVTATHSNVGAAVLLLLGLARLRRRKTRAS